jgi:hypothetical protein
MHAGKLDTRRNMGQGAIVSSRRLNTKISRSNSRRVAYKLETDGGNARLAVEDGRLQMFKSMESARKYLHQNIDWILRNYGAEHELNRKDVIMVS